MTWTKGHKLNCGENNPRYVDGHTMYRDMVDRSKCQQCGKPRNPKKPQSIEVHHRDGDRTHNKPENLKALCTDCHHIRGAIKTGKIVVDTTDAPFPFSVDLGS